MQSLKSLAGQTAVYGLSSILGRFLNYLLTPLYTYQFAAGEYGVVTEMYAYVAFLVVMLTFGMETAFFRYASREKNFQSVYLSALIPVLAISAVFTLFCLYFSNGIASFISYEGHPEFVSWFAMIIGLDVVSSIPLARLRHENRAGKFARINILTIAVNIALNLFFIAYCKVKFESGESNDLVRLIYKPEIGVGYIFIANLISSAFRCLLLAPQLVFWRDPFKLKSIFPLFIYGFPLLIAGLAGIANENLDRLLLKYLLIPELGLEQTMAQVGIYGACYKVSILITLFVQAYRYAAEPFFFSKSGQADDRETYAMMMKYFVIICLMIFLGLMVNIDYVMLFVGDEYRVGARVVPILLLANIFLGIYYNLSVWYKLTDKTKFGAYIAAFGALVTIFFNLILIPEYGYMGSAWATLICYVSMVLASYFFSRTYFPVPYPLIKISFYFLLVMALSLSFHSVNWSGNLLRLFAGNAILLGTGGLIYLLERPKKMIT